MASPSAPMAAAAAEDTVPKLFARVCRDHGLITAQLSKDAHGRFQPTSYTELYAEVGDLAAGLAELGVRPGDRVGLLADNRREWLAADLAILGLGAADVPRGADSTAEDFRFILAQVESAVCLVEDGAQLDKVLSVRAGLPHLRTIVVIDPGGMTDDGPPPGERDGVAVIPYAEVLRAGRAVTETQPDFYRRRCAQGAAGDVATIIFTSGTTGEPKGVVLTHRNFVFQTGCIPEFLATEPGQIWLSVLPVWHSFERIFEYCAIASATTLAYSKPVASVLIADMAAVRPHWMASVPRIWDAVRSGVYRNVEREGGAKKALFSLFVAAGNAHTRARARVHGLVAHLQPRSRSSEMLGGLAPFLLLSPLKALGGALVFAKIKERLGGRFRGAISGGGALPDYVDEFFAAAGVLLLNAYGLTETAPGVAIRPETASVSGTVGRLLPGTGLRIVDDRGRALGPGRLGVVHVRGPQVMDGYFKRPDLTRAVLRDGWLDTGDLGMTTIGGDLIIRGRAKDTIVLLGGENVEPLPIEERMQESRYVDRAVVVGQDQRSLAALVVLNQESVTEYAAAAGIDGELPALSEHPRIRALIRAEVDDRVNAANGFKPFERISRVHLLHRPFQVGHELSHKQEVKRAAVAELYAEQIARLFA